MTLKEAISQLKSLKVYAEGEIPVYDTMRDNDDNVWVGDVQALGIAIEALEQRNAGCDFCLRRDFDYPGSHDFRVVEDGLYFLTVSLAGKEWMRRIARNAGENCALEKRTSCENQGYGAAHRCRTAGTIAEAVGQEPEVHKRRAEGTNCPQARSGRWQWVPCEAPSYEVQLKREQGW